MKIVAISSWGLFRNDDKNIFLIIMGGRNIFFFNVSNGKFLKIRQKISNFANFGE